MTKQLLTSVFTLLSINICYSQTEKAETTNLTNRYKSGKISSETYSKHGKAWMDLMHEIETFPELPYDSVQNQLVYNKILITELNKTENFERILEWAAINFGSLNSVLHYKNQESGRIILKGYFDVNHILQTKMFWGNTKEGMTKTTCYQTYLFTIKDQKVKFEIINIRYKYSRSQYYSNGSYIPKKEINISIQDIYPITNWNSDKWKEQLDLLVQTNSEIIKLSSSLQNFLDSYKNDFGF